MTKKFTNKLQNIVLSFQKTFGHPHKDKPTLPELERFVNRKGWGAIEESIEQLHVLSNNEEEFAAAVQRIREYVDIAEQKQKDKVFIIDLEEKLAALADGLGDELWFLMGDLVEAGIDAEPIMLIIEESNNSKLFTAPDGTKYAKQDENDKIIKSPDFFPPEERIKEEIRRQLGL